MSVILFVQERSGNFNLILNLGSVGEARNVISMINSTRGYWFDATLNLVEGECGWSDDGTVFIPFHRIDRMEIRD